VKHKSVPSWVEAATAPTFGSGRSWPILSELIGRIEVRCAQCQRHGLYRVDRLLAEVGDVSVPQAIDEIAKRAGCPRALKPPSIGDINYASGKCQIRRVVRE
jgi:hypothetical protein